MLAELLTLDTAKLDFNDYIRWELLRFSLEDEVKEVVDLQANLTSEEKGLVEFMRDGPKSVQQAGHWFIFAQNVSVRDNHTLDDDVKMYFLVEMADMDEFIASWDAKMF